MFAINNIEWFIIFVPSGCEELTRSDGSVTLGVTDNTIQIIFIDNALYGKRLKKVLCHELTHAAMFSYNINLTLEQEELVADLIATYGEEIINITNKLFQKLKGEDYYY